jgi:hypothetical protein
LLKISYIIPENALYVIEGSSNKLKITMLTMTINRNDMLIFCKFLFICCDSYTCLTLLRQFITCLQRHMTQQSTINFKSMLFSYNLSAVIVGIIVFLFVILSYRESTRGESDKKRNTIIPQQSQASCVSWYVSTKLTTSLSS